MQWIQVLLWAVSQQTGSPEKVSDIIIIMRFFSDFLSSPFVFTPLRPVLLPDLQIAHRALTRELFNKGFSPWLLNAYISCCRICWSQQVSRWCREATVNNEIQYEKVSDGPQIKNKCQKRVSLLYCEVNEHWWHFWWCRMKILNVLSAIAAHRQQHFWM